MLSLYGFILLSAVGITSASLCAHRFYYSTFTPSPQVDVVCVQTVNGGPFVDCVNNMFGFFSIHPLNLFAERRMKPRTPLGPPTFLG